MQLLATARSALAPLLFVLMALAWAPVAGAVDLNGSLKGTVTDTDGLVVPGVQLVLTSPNLQGDRTTQSDGEGRYRFAPLPPGTFELEASKPGFRSWRSPPFDLGVAESLQLAIELPLAGSADEEIVVIGAAPTVDTESTVTGAQLDTEYLKHLPSASRDYQSAMAVVPGVTGGGNPNVHGGFDTSNQYYIDGVNTTDPVTNTFSMNMNYDAIESIQVLTGGMDAEYGRALGGAVNLVTKSGGNEFEGSAHFVYGSNALILAPTIEGDNFNDETQQTLGLHLGGPIVKDKVWFFVGTELSRYISSLSFDPDEVGRDLDKFPFPSQDWRSGYLFGKVTTQLSPSHRLWVHAQADPTWIDNATQDPYTLPQAESVFNQGGWLASINHQYTPSERAIVETQLDYFRTYLDYFSILWKDCNNFNGRVCTDDFVGQTYLGQPVTESWYGLGANDFSSGESPEAGFDRRQRLTLNSSYTRYWDWLGEHETKVGVQAEYMGTQFEGAGYADGLPYFTAGDGDPNDMDAYTPVVLDSYSNNFDSRLDGGLGSLFLQDVYKPHDRVTLRPGLRLDSTVLREHTQTTTNTLYSRATLAPRFGMAFDLTGDQKTALHAYYGRFYDSGFLVIADLLRKSGTSFASLPWDEEAQAFSEEAQFAAAGTFLVHEPLKNPYSDEINIGIDRQVVPRLRVGALLVYKQAFRFWEDDDVNLIWNADGTAVIGSRDGSGEAIYRMRTPTSSFSRYTSLELTVNKQYANNWTLLGSYTLSRAYGSQSADQATASLDVPEQRQYEIGLLDFDVTHVLKLSGTWDYADLVSVGRTGIGPFFGWNAIAQSGVPYRPVFFNPTTSSFDLVDRAQDGSFRLPWISSVDAMVGAQFEYRQRINWELGLNFLNLLNTRTFTDVRTDVDEDLDLEHPDQTFGTPIDRQFPRSVQIVVRGEF